MINEAKPTGAVGSYSTAYASHYSWRDLPLALQQYEDVIASYPETAEADYSRMQIHNIVTTVVTKQELMDSQLQLARVHFGHHVKDAVARIPVAVPIPTKS